MDNMTKAQFRKLALSLLNDDNGVSEEAFCQMVDFLDRDVRDCVKATDGRFYISPENFDSLSN